MTFEKFTQSARSFAPKVSLSATGVINFNHGALKRMQLNEFKICILYYDRAAHQIGIEFSHDDKAEGALNLRKRLTGADLGARKFLDFFNIRPSVLTIYDLEAGDRANFYVIHLNQGKEKIVKHNRRTQYSHES